jgi:hypothetical protein
MSDNVHTRFYSKCFPLCGKRAKIWLTMVNAGPFLQDSTMYDKNGTSDNDTKQQISRARIFGPWTLNPLQMVMHLNPLWSLIVAVHNCAYIMEFHYY